MGKSPLGLTCPCTDAVFVTVEWACPKGHLGYAALCKQHGQIHVAALLSDGIMCGRCRESEGREVAVALQKVNGKRVNRKLGRTILP